MSESKNHISTVPQHLAVVMDGNGRWAKKRLLPRAAGHRAGVNATRSLVENCVKHGIDVLTIFAFSSENWDRPTKEVDSLMKLFASTLAGEVGKLHKQNVRVRFIGDRLRFSMQLQHSITDAELLTADNTGLQLNIAANYGGRWDVLTACKALVEKALRDNISADSITEELLMSELSTGNLPYPDLFIRTGGESRISNFLIWQLAYSELYFDDVLWPDFDEKSLIQAMQWYSTRQRRFGKTSSQVLGSDKKAI